LREALRRLRERAIAGQDCAALAREIRDALLPAPLRAHIDRPRSANDRLLVLLHGPLEAAPMELLGIGEGLFDDELCLVALPGLPALEPGLAPSPEQLSIWRLLGSPLDGAQGEGPPQWLLPGAREELESLARLHPAATIALGSNFDRPALERALRSDACLHVATHLEVKPGAARSRFPAAGLRLCDGDVVSANEIADMGPRLPLVVLSACETGGGRYSDGEGLFGVARAFLEGGTRNLVVTLWPVEDGAARDFSLAFHHALDAGMRPSQAASAARSALRAKGRSSADWAAFRFLGRD
jgi:CHAT domain-containing protein